MADKKAKETATKKANSEERTDDKTYQAVLQIGGETVARITLRASDDEDAKEQLKTAQPSHFDGMGEWKLTKTETVEVK